MVNLLLDSARCEQAVYDDVLPLANSPTPLPRLHVSARVPVRVVDEHPIRPGQIDAQAAHFGGEQKDEHRRVGVELTDQPLTGAHGRRAVHSQVAVLAQLNVPLDNVQHLTRLREEEHFVVLFLPRLTNIKTVSFVYLKWFYLLP